MPPTPAGGTVCGNVPEAVRAVVPGDDQETYPPHLLRGEEDRGVEGPREHRAGHGEGLEADPSLLRGDEDHAAHAHHLVRCADVRLPFPLPRFESRQRGAHARVRTRVRGGGVLVRVRACRHQGDHVHAQRWACCGGRAREALGEVLRGDEDRAAQGLRADLGTTCLPRRPVPPGARGANRLRGRGDEEGHGEGREAVPHPSYRAHQHEGADQVQFRPLSCQAWHGLPRV